MTPLLLIALVAPPPPTPIRRVEVGRNVMLEIDGSRRRVVVASSVVLRKGPLEGLLTRVGKKEHEYILAADVDARHVHTALELAQAKSGRPTRFAPKYLPAEGTPIRVSLRYVKGGRSVTEVANEWMRDDKTNKPLPGVWVFAGSRFSPNPEGDDKPPFYLANHGDLICVVNIESALLDLPRRSPKAFNDRLYRADTDRIPPTGTKVEVILEPVAP